MLFLIIAKCYFLVIPALNEIEEVTETLLSDSDVAVKNIFASCDDSGVWETQTGIISDSPGFSAASPLSKTEDQPCPSVVTDSL